jgi:hypothetical protein
VSKNWKLIGSSIQKIEPPAPLQAAGMDGKEWRVSGPFPTAQAPVNGIQHLASIDGIKGDAVDALEFKDKVLEFFTDAGESTAVILVQDAPGRRAHRPALDNGPMHMLVQIIRTAQGRDTQNFVIRVQPGGNSGQRRTRPYG